MSDKTVAYYNENAGTFFASTVNADMSVQYDLFLKHVPDGGYILDLGCGSGRDSKYFLEKGYKVEAVDGSPVLCEKASKLIGQPVRQLLFQDFDYTKQFDAVWASASLLHIPKENILLMFDKINASLKQNGIFYVSFKNGNFEGERNGRLFADFTKDSFAETISESNAFELLDIQITSDVRVGRSDEKWLNLILRNIKGDI